MKFKLALMLLLAPLVVASAAESVPIGSAVTLKNRFLQRTWSTEGGKLRTTSIVNVRAKLPATVVTGDEFRLRVSESTDVEGTDRILTAADFRVTAIESKTADGIESVTFQLTNDDFQVELKAWLAPDDFYLRKQLTLTARKRVTIEEINVDVLDLADVLQPYTINRITAQAPGEFKPNLGQPLYGTATGTFWGIEFPAALNRVEKGRLRCGYQHGRTLEAGRSHRSYASVMGVSDDPKFTADAFFDYIDRIRVRPFHLQVQYNSWFDYGDSVNKGKFRQSVRTINDELVLQRGVRPLDAYVIDSGWTNPGVSWVDGYWKANTNKFDADFATTLKDVADAKSHLGLWTNPGCIFGAQPSVGKLREAGFEAMGSWMSLAGPRHMKAFEDRMVELTKLGVAVYKFDGIFGHLNTREFELHGNGYGLPEMPQLGAGTFSPSDKRLNDAKYDELKIYYLSASTELLMKCLDRMTAANPKIYTVISNAAYLSPWWLQHADSVWMINSDDSGSGSRTAELVYRDARLYKLAVTEKTQFPMNAIFNHEPQKTGTEPPEKFRNYLYMAFSRGSGFLELYLRPSSLKPMDWDVLAEGLAWTDITGPAFKHSRMHGGDPAKTVPYGFAGWTSDTGYVSIHNPSLKQEATYSLTLNRSLGMLPGTGPFLLSSPLADSTRDLKNRYAFGDTIEVTLKPGEVRILNFSTKPIEWSPVKTHQDREKRNSGKNQ